MILFEFDFFCLVSEKIYMFLDLGIKLAYSCTTRISCPASPNTARVLPTLCGSRVQFSQPVGVWGGAKKGASLPPMFSPNRITINELEPSQRTNI
jgi:hypothetical protein